MRGYLYTRDQGTVLHSVGIDEAAGMLAQDVPTKSAAQWKAWLYNNTKPARRVSYRIPFGKLLGKLSFSVTDLNRVISIEKAKANLSSGLAPEDFEWLNNLLATATTKPPLDV